MNCLSTHFIMSCDFSRRKKMLACVLLRPCPYQFIIENVQNVLISALAYVEYHIPRIKSDDELRLYSNIMKRPGEKNGTWQAICTTGSQQLCMSCLQNHGKWQPPQREAFLTLGAISAFALEQMKTEALSVFFNMLKSPQAHGWSLCCVSL